MRQRPADSGPCATVVYRRIREWNDRRPILHKKPAKHGPQSILLLTNVTMSEPVPHLPPEIVDDIIELLHDDRNTLHRCCLVSKSWIPRARRYIFNKITLNSLSLKAWIKSFPDPEKSPAHYARSLVLVGHGMQIEGTGESGWIQSFINVASFAVYSIEDAKLKFFHNLSPAVKSLCVSGSAPVSNILALACSFPFLRDLEVLYVKPINFVDQDGAAFKPSFSPMSARTLTLDCPLEAITTQMSDLPGGPRFEEIVWKFHYTRMTVSEFGWMAALMKECSQTLKYMSICCTDGPREPRLFHSITGSVSDPDFF